MINVNDAARSNRASQIGNARLQRFTSMPVIRDILQVRLNAPQIAGCFEKQSTRMRGRRCRAASTAKPIQAARKDRPPRSGTNPAR